MPPNPRLTARTRADILQHAGRVFRLRGWEGTTIDDVMLAAGLTRGAFYAHFESKEALFAEVVGSGPSLLGRLRSGSAKAALDAYLDRADLAATVQSCTLAALAGDVARAPLGARLAWANVLHGTIAALAEARGRRNRLDGAATEAALLAIGAVVLARASGDPRLGDWLLRTARRAAARLLRPPASPRKKRSKSRRKAAGGRPPRRAARSPGGRAAAAPKGRSSATRR